MRRPTKAKAGEYYHVMTSTALRCAAVVGAALALGACGKPAQSTYKPSVVPGISQERAVAILRKPSQSQVFDLRDIHAVVLSYPFGQVLSQHGTVVAVIIASEPAYLGPYGISLGLSQEQVKSALQTHKKRRYGHKISYDVVVGDNDTKTIDWYIDSDHLMVEMASANANDPDAGYNVVSIALADKEGLHLLSAVTQAKLMGLYPGQHVYNYVQEPWSM